MQRARHDFISGKPDVSDSKYGREALSLSSGECIGLLTLWFIILRCFFDAETNGPLSMYWFNISIVHAIRMHVSEVPCSGAVSALSICVQMNRTLAHLLQPSQGLLNKPRPSASRSDHFTQTNRALGLRRGSGMVQNTQCG